MLRACVCAAKLALTPTYRAIHSAETGIEQAMKLINLLPPEQSVHILTLVLETECKLSKAMEAHFSLAGRLRSTKQQLMKAMYRAGVVNGPSMLDYVQYTKGLSGLLKEEAWAHMLAEDEELMQCILTDIPQWADAVKRKTEKEQQDIVAGKIVAVHADRNNRVHRFPPSLGLLIYEGVPSKEATTVLRCVAERNAIPYRVKKVGSSGGSQ